jgi:hypothetical protein
MPQSIPDFFKQQRPHGGMLPGEYQRYFEMKVTQARQEALPDRDDYARYLPLNLQRTNRIGSTYMPSSKVRAAVRAIPSLQLWMVLTEPWCGDSAQNLFYITKIAACSASIELRILLRDQNQDIMEAFLTSGTRSIPKLVAFDAHGRELFRWGPGPQPAAELFGRLKESGIPTEDVRRRLHLWYARNRGRALEAEFLVLLNGLVL